MGRAVFCIQENRGSAASPVQRGGGVQGDCTKGKWCQNSSMIPKVIYLIFGNVENEGYGRSGGLGCRTLERCVPHLLARA